MPLSAFENSATIIFTERCLNKWIKNYKAFVGMYIFNKFSLGSHSTVTEVRSNFVGFHFSRLTQLQNSISENRICPLGNGQKDTVSLLRGLCSQDPRDGGTQLDPAIWKKLQTPLSISKLHLAEGLVIPAGVCYLMKDKSLSRITRASRAVINGVELNSQPRENKIS